MKISEEQRQQYLDEGFMIVPGFLSPEELDTVRTVCDTRIADIEADMKSCGVPPQRAVRRQDGGHPDQFCVAPRLRVLGL